MGMTSNKLKIFAITAMFFDHAVSVFWSPTTVSGMILKIIGRTVAPIFCFLIADGYYHTSNRIKYIVRLLIFAVISHIPYSLVFGYRLFEYTSVMWGLALGLIALTAFKNNKIHIILRLLIVAVCCALSWRADWNVLTVLWILGFGIFHGNFKRQIIWFCAIGFVFRLMFRPMLTYIRFGSFNESFPPWYQVGFFLAIPLLMMYNGQRGIKSKAITWAFYIFYPAHLILFYLLKRFTPLAEILGGLL